VEGKGVEVMADTVAAGREVLYPDAMME